MTDKLKRITKAVIPAAGKGTRLHPLTKAIPKELVPLGRRPVLEYVVEEAVSSGVTDILFVISREKTAIRTHFGDGADGVSFYYTFQDEQRGLADAIYCAREFAADEPFAVVLGDSVIYTDRWPIPFRRLLDIYEQTDAQGVILVQKTPREEVGRYGIVEPVGEAGESFRINGLVEKPRPEDAPSNYAIAGRYAFDPHIFDCIRRTPIGANGEYQITDSIGVMLADGRPVWCAALQGSEVRRDIGAFQTYFEAFAIEIRREQQQRTSE